MVRSNGLIRSREVGYRFRLRSKLRERRTAWYFFSFFMLACPQPELRSVAPTGALLKRKFGDTPSSLTAPTPSFRMGPPLTPAPRSSTMKNAIKAQQAAASQLGCLDRRGRRSEVRLWLLERAESEIQSEWYENGRRKKKYQGRTH